MLGSRLAIFEHLAVFRGRPLLAQADVHDGKQGRDGCAQLVRNVGGSLLLAGKRFLQLLERFVQAARDRLQLTRQVIDIDIKVKILGRHLAHSFRQARAA